MNYSKIKKFDVANGPGIRTSLFVSGCTNCCEGCFNPETWDFDYGEYFSEEIMKDILDSLDNENIEGLSILGGEPLNVRNIKKVGELVAATREKYGSKKNIWIWTGYVLEEIFYEEDVWKVISMADVLVDGRFVLEEKNLKLKYRGSNNQRVIDIEGSVGLKTLILKED